MNNICHAREGGQEEADSVICRPSPARQSRFSAVSTPMIEQTGPSSSNDLDSIRPFDSCAQFVTALSMVSEVSAALISRAEGGAVPFLWGVAGPSSDGPKGSEWLEPRTL
nr:hypothetical protein [Nonomuraea lactucae]